ncbi:MAG: hypothetical protein E7265_02545 [Lachnospiraceae bacterium]|nr:hypothetical protein [Lachnospiraceae bacterium]
MIFNGKKIKAMIGILGMSVILPYMGYAGVSAEEGNTVIITGGAEPTATPVGTDAYIAGNDVIIIAPTEQPAAPTTAPSNVVSGEETGKTATIDLNSESTPKPEDSDNKKESSKKKPKTTKKPNVSKAENKVNPTAKPVVKEPEDDIPKTGVVRWEFIFLGAGVLLLGAGTVLSLRYIRK